MFLICLGLIEVENCFFILVFVYVFRMFMLGFGICELGVFGFAYIGVLLGLKLCSSELGV